MASITQVHRERSEMILRCLETDVVRNGISADAAAAALAGELGMSVEAVKLAVAIANDTRAQRAGR